MSTSRIPAPAPYRRPDGMATSDGLAQSQPSVQYGPNSQIQQEHTQALQGLGLASSDPELLLRQRLAPELQQWNQQQQQQMAPPPAPPQQQQQQVADQFSVGSLQNQEEQHYAGSTQSPVSEAPTPRGTTRSSTKKAPTRTSRRRKGATKEESDDGDISEEFTMEGVKTKSGRKVHRPAHFNPAQKTPSRRRGPYRRNYDARICKICQRGHSPQSNMIVFCDGCNTPYHQLCHDPPIDDLVIAVAEAEWFCASCSKLRQARPLEVGMSGETLSEEEKRLYLANLPKTSLVDLIFYCESQHPTLPLYDPQTQQIVANLKNGSGTAQTRDQSADGTPMLTGEDGDEEGKQDGANIAGAPNWEDMIVRAVSAIANGSGAQPKAIFEWIESNFPALEGGKVRTEAQSSLQSALRKGRLVREGHIYRTNIENKPAKPVPAAAVDAYVTTLGSGIKLPPETADEDGMLVDDDLIAFSHRFYLGPEGDDVMEGIVANGHTVGLNGAAAPANYDK